MTPHRLVYRVSEVAAMLGDAPDTIYRLIREGRLQARQHRRFIVVTMADLADYVNALPLADAPDRAEDEPVVHELPARPVRRSRQRVVRLVEPVVGVGS